MRIDKFLAQMGVGTRTEVKALLKKGAVMCNGVKIKSAKTQIDPEHDTVEVEGQVITYEPYVYLMMNKPQDVISATVDDRHQTVIDLIDNYQHLDLFPVGRLDKDTEGLLLITNDGQFNHALMSPNKHVSKTYWVQAKDPLKASDSQTFEAGITLKEGQLQPAHLEILEERTTAFVTIQEGKYHQVKRMFHAIDNEIVALKRVSIGALKLDSQLSPGDYRPLTADELKLLNVH
ncbi:pseudouridine synthase [Staphylococcus intermedius]|uniref:Pseudouridine synthase n=1 Tax=Staphylococcus intermedius NCTC 11048 TaxID=1141106 RepID=A0A380G5M0_STAIN|nr:pseudouridine synthase [Staphylococcus intermedius]PCF64624.1 16S rRNA pseudouridine(516) synthase [Staphylococcus intermedius]PCF80234.1 16S rRNA pseudouridine(516) synthase [Staphylococcus intermedius]PCF81584.1 16S rRNA pseudouridine(516) synthase [Staphylococcus intermedius]PCF84344.1 16S rRNA pseudouridine(516) synthase [Staphylococcus intermedius]PCF86451.1 16S rRNA pseudouridine(516) synthase [Staphylococcus intermedius]